MKTEIRPFHSALSSRVFRVRVTMFGGIISFIGGLVVRSEFRIVFESACSECETSVNFTPRLRAITPRLPIVKRNLRASGTSVEWSNNLVIRTRGTRTRPVWTRLF